MTRDELLEKIIDEAAEKDAREVAAAELNQAAETLRVQYEADLAKLKEDHAVKLETALEAVQVARVVKG